MMSNCKRRGEWAELQFMAKAAKFGLRISKPWGEMERYDVAIDTGSHFIRVQIKSTTSKRSGGLYYMCGLRTGNAEKPYRRGEFDFVAVYIIPEDIWYIIPAGLVVTGKVRAILLFPSSPTSKYGPYREAWDLLR
jgi:PD-(D/E)XK endonuclease